MKTNKSDNTHTLFGQHQRKNCRLSSSPFDAPLFCGE